MNNSGRIYRIALFFVLAYLVLGFSSCSHQQKIPFEYSENIADFLYLPQELETQFKLYWAGRSAGRLEQTYEMEAPYIREITPYTIYYSLLSNGNPIERLKIQRIRALSNLYYEIGLSLYYQQKKGPAKDIHMTDRWVYADDKWFHVIKDPVFKKHFP